MTRGFRFVALLFFVLGVWFGADFWTRFEPEGIFVGIPIGIVAAGLFASGLFHLGADALDALHEIAQNTRPRKTTPPKQS